MEEEKKFLKGFNAGYQLAKHSPELSNKLKKGIQKSENPYVSGFFAGTHEFNKEIIKEQLKGKIKKARKSIERGKGYERK
ncbi:MAG: hypothetical protein AAFZ15_29500 [Bacteroidota bacterium]